MSWNSNKGGNLPKPGSCRRRIPVKLILVMIGALFGLFYIKHRHVSRHHLSETKRHANDLEIPLWMRKDTALREETYFVKKGDTLENILLYMGVDKNVSSQVVDALSTLKGMKHLDIGDEITFYFDNNDLLQKIVYAASLADVYCVEKKDSGYVAYKIHIPVRRETALIKLEIKTSLYDAFIDAGETPLLVDQLVDILSWDIDFYSDLRKGDKVSVIVEKEFVGSEFFRYGRVLMVEYNGEVVSVAGAYFVGKDGVGGYYDSEGRSLAKNFLKTPVKFTRISSGFGMRVHPVTHMLKKHLGTDYAAPVGAPVWAMADGVILQKGYSRTNGNYIAIRHRNGYETYYLHLSRFHPSVSVGMRVRQKDIIGYVGATGLATGPHLHLGVKYRGEFIDPLKLKKVKEEVLGGDDLLKFKKYFDEMHLVISLDYESPFDMRGLFLDSYSGGDA